MEKHKQDRSPSFSVATQGAHLNSHISLEDCLRDTEGYIDPFPPMLTSKFNDDITIVDEGAIGIGFKARAAGYAMSQLETDEIFYVATRQGYAPVSLAYLCKKLGKKLTLIAPACKEISEHQAAAIEMGASIRFIRVVAMPVANSIAQELADAVGGYYFKGGLKDDNVFKGAVRVLYDNLTQYEIEKMWMVTSTGVLARSLQTALPNTEFNTVAVSRNIQADDIGRVKGVSYHKPFGAEADLITGFDTVRTYDAKGLQYLIESGQKSWFFSVGREMKPTTIDKAGFNSWMSWEDRSQFPEVMAARKLKEQEQFKLF